MSTRSTIAYGDTFHLYSDALDSDHIYLELEGTNFEASYNRVIVPIPVHIWEVIRKYTIAQFDLVEMDDKALEAFVKKEVTERLKQIAEDKAAKGKDTSIYAWFGSATYGSGDDPYEKQVETGVASLRRERAHQREIKAAIENLKRAQKQTVEETNG